MSASGSERRDRRWYRLAPLYLRLTGAPPVCAPGDAQAAAVFLAGVEAALQVPGWTPSERRRLQVWRRVWTARAEGRDPHFQQYGTAKDRTASSGVDRVVERWRDKGPQVGPSVPDRRKTPRK